MYAMKVKNGNEFVSGAGDLRFKSRAGHIGHSVIANGSLSLRKFLKKVALSAGAMMPRWAPQTCYTRFGLIMKDLI